MAKTLRQKLSEGLLIVDGAMGTQLMARGAEAGQCNNYLNIKSPQIITDIHLSYFDAGSGAVYTNTFGANEITLGRHNLADQVEEINAAGVENARKAALALGGQKYVIGDIGPCGDFLEPLGTLKPDVLRNAYARQAKALLNAGVDGFVVETFMAADEAKVAVEGVKSVSDLPVFVSFAFDAAGDDFRTMMGVTVEMAVTIFSVMGIDALGFNCGTLRMEQYLQLAKKFLRLLKSTTGTGKLTPGQGAGSKEIALIAKPNGGKPELIDGKAVYKLSEGEFGEWIEKIHQAGAAIVGGCCGTTPAHIKAMAKKLKS
ncbi:MAG: Bifunctional homocysteine S-methyltransferase/5,10-methylenetetrahydrofolate reductase [Planctomycetes bacterium ADurb.Bin401]|nr:MAG: Bifunctional homocysteine S-methyltransferase/5,10-methylenetetrahydrofolate reductase [Planctomycetes bacterium ADurb.Bin401]